MKVKRCNDCGITKPVDQFYKTKQGWVKSICKICSVRQSTEWAKRNRRRITEHNKSLRHQDPFKAAELKRKYRYGLSIGQYLEMHKSQDGKCLICEKQTKLYIDHCHQTKKVRGLLCHSCNTGIGFLHHDPEIIRAAIKYLL